MARQTETVACYSAVGATAALAGGGGGRARHPVAVGSHQAVSH